MKKIIILFLVLFFCGCNAQKYLQRNTAKVIDRYLEKADTIYLYSVAFENVDFIWFHQGDYIYSFTIKPYEVKTNKAIKAKNIKIEDDCIDKYFDISINKDVQCFDHTLDGEWVKMYVKGEKSKMTSINIACLLKTSFKQNTFPHKLQYDFSRIIESKYLNFTMSDMN